MEICWPTIATGYGEPQDRVATSALPVSLSEHATRYDLVLVDLDVVGRGPHHAHVDVLATVLDLEIPAYFRHHVAQEARVPPESHGVVHREAHPVHAGHAANERLSGIDVEQVGAEGRDSILHRFLGPAPQRHHGYHGCHPNHDSQGGEEGAELVGPNGS
jgi:hypothetical protein